MNNYIFEELLVTIKKKSEIRNTEQAVEFISLFILMQYIKLSQPNINAPRFNINQASRNELNEVKHYYQQLYRNFILSSNHELISPLIYEKTNNKITFLLDNISDIELIKYIDHTLSSIKSLTEFHNYSDAYSALIFQMVQESGRSGEYVTPYAIIQLMVKMLSPENGKSIYDPACGTSSLLIESARHIKSQSEIGPREDYTLFGNDISSFACLISIVNLLFNKESSFHINLRDSLEINNDQIKYDFVITNPPFGKKIDFDPYSKNTHYRGNNSDYHFLDHTINSLKPGGKAAIILPERFLYDTSKECIPLKEILLIKYNLEYVLSVPSGALLPYTGAKLCILFFSHTGPTKDIYFYQLNPKEKYSRSNMIRIDDFYDFLYSVKNKTSSDHSWIINFDSSNHDFNLIKNEERNSPQDILNTSLLNLDSTIENNNLLIDELKSLRNKITSLEKIINSSHFEMAFQKLKISDNFIVKSGMLLQKNKLMNEGPIPVYGGNGIIGYNSEAKEHGETIIIGKVGALCGNIHYVNDDVWVTNNALILKNKFVNKLSTAYISKLLSVLNLRQLAVGTAQQYITTSQIKNLEVIVPSFENQVILNDWFDELNYTLCKYSDLIGRINRDKETLKAKLFDVLLTQ